MLTRNSPKKTGSRRPKNTDSRHEWFKYQLRLKGSSCGKIATALGISRAAVSRGILSPSPRLAQAVSEALGKTKSDLWPARYPEEPIKQL